MASNLRVDSIVPTTSGNVSIGTATGGVTIPGNLGVGGVLTYEDVTNVDSVGVITARDGLRVTGVTTFTDNVTTEKNILNLVGTSWGDEEKLFTNFKRGSIDLGRFGVEADGGGTGGQLIFECGLNSSPVERLRITSDGKVGINTDSPISTLDVKGAIVANGSFYQEQAGVTNGGSAQDKTVTFNARGVILVLISYSLGNITTDVSRNVYSLGLFTPRSNGATWTAINQDTTSTHVGNLTISDAGSAGALRVQKSAGSDSRACAFRIDVLSNANTQFTITDT